MRGATSAPLTQRRTCRFLLTHPMRGATLNFQKIILLVGNFYSRTPCEVRLPILKRLALRMNFYSRTPCEVRRKMLTHLKNHSKFLLTHPMRGATRTRKEDASPIQISTHAPHARCDTGRAKRTLHLYRFLLTHPMRGATPDPKGWRRTSAISTHAPHARCDVLAL